MHRDDETTNPVTYQVQYQRVGKDDWFVMTCRNHDERFRSEVEHSMHELTDLDEAIDTAQALANGYAHPDKRDAYYWQPILAARVVTIVRMSVVSATYGTPQDESVVNEGESSAPIEGE